MKVLPGTEIRVYRGMYVHPAARNASGMRYWTIGPRGFLRADTLNGMRALIRREREVQS